MAVRPIIGAAGKIHGPAGFRPAGPGYRDLQGSRPRCFLKKPGVLARASEKGIIPSPRQIPRAMRNLFLRDGAECKSRQRGANRRQREPEIEAKTSTSPVDAVREGAVCHLKTYYQPAIRVCITGLADKQGTALGPLVGAQSGIIRRSGWVYRKFICVLLGNFGGGRKGLSPQSRYLRHCPPCASPSIEACVLLPVCRAG